jgi:hypothetical protein
MKRAITGAFACVVGANLLGCSGLFGPRVVHDVSVQTDACGNFVVSVDAEASGRALDIAVNGESEERFRVDGRQVMTWLGSGEPGLSYTVDVTLKGVDPVTTTVTLPAVQDAVTVSLSNSHVYQGNDEAIVVEVSDVCVDEASPAWRVAFDTALPAEGTMLPSNRTQRIPLSNDLGIGVHEVFVTVQLSDFVKEDEALVFEVEPPCADADADGTSTCAGDCDDADASVNTCPESTDRDGDGFTNLVAGGGDCDDANSAFHPGAAEGPDADGDGFFVLDGLDQDCDGVVDQGRSETDCDDSNRSVNPGRDELGTPNSLDDNCDGRIDEGTIVFDDDGDGYSEQDGDCDDANSAVSPGAVEIADCRDDNCDGVVDEGLSFLAVDDSFENNDTWDQAHALPGGRNKFTTSLDVVMRDGSDEEWFTFYSSDGLFDTWGIVATMQVGPQQSRVELAIADASGNILTRRTVSADGEAVRLTGRGSRNDSGTYLLRVRSLSQPHDYCPAQVSLRSR